MANMYALNVARFWRFPESRRQGGWALPRLVLFTSQEVTGQGGHAWGHRVPLSPSPPQR